MRGLVAFARRRQSQTPPAHYARARRPLLPPLSPVADDAEHDDDANKQDEYEQKIRRALRIEARARMRSRLVRATRPDERRLL